MHSREFPKLPDYCTYLPILTACIGEAMKIDGDRFQIVELGCGIFSTQIISGMCYKYPFDSYESSWQWYERINNMPYMRPEDHHLHLVSQWDEFKTHLYTDYELSVCFVDLSPDSDRGEVIKSLRHKCKFIVVHDSASPKPAQVDTWEKRFASYPPAFATYKWRFDYHTIGPSTTVVSDYIDVSEMFKNLKVELSDMTEYYKR